MKKIIHSITFRYALPIHLSTIIGIILWLVFLLLSANAQAQWTITATNTNFTQDFDGMGSSAGTIPGGFKAALGNNHATNGTQTDASTTSYPSNLQGGCYNFGYSQNTTDRSLGFINSGSYSAPRSITLQIVNNTGAAIDTVKLSWKYEKYRSGNRQWEWNFFYGSPSSPTTNYPPGNQTYASDGGNATAYTPPIIINKSITLTNVHIPVGASYYFRWTLTGSGGSTNGMALSIDDVVINCRSAAPVCTPGTPNVNLGNNVSYCVGETFSAIFDAQNSGGSYEWNNGATTQTFTANTAGTYSVKVTDSNGCIGRDTVVVTENPLPTLNLGNDTAYCAGTGFNLLLDAQNAGASYDWNNGTSGLQTFAADTAGIYKVEVTHTNGCAAMDSIIITENALPIVNLGNDTGFCANTPISLVLDAGNLGSTYSWNNGTAITQTYTATQTGTYSVLVTDTNGCIGSSQIVITEHALPSVNLGNDTAYCAGASFLLLLDATHTGATYSWNGGLFSAPIFVVTLAGPYWVTVTNAHGCSASDSVSITEYALPNANLGSDVSYCAGSNFSQVLNVQNTVGSSYVWGNGSITPTVTATQAGLYSVTVTDTNGCVNRDSLVVSEIALPHVDLGNDVWISGNSHILNAGGFASYRWLPNLQTTQQITVAQSGTYIVFVTNGAGCEASDTIMVTLGSLFVKDEYANNAMQVYPNPSTGVFQINLTESGTFRLDIITTAGQSVLSKSISTISGTPIQVDISHLPNGVYHLILSNPTTHNSQKIIINH